MDESMKKYLNGKRFMYEHVTHRKTLTIDKQKDFIFNKSINVPRRSMKGLLPLFYEPYTKGARDSEEFLSRHYRSESDAEWNPE